MKGTWRQALIGFFWPIVVLLALRWAVVEPYVIPSGSMIPNLLIHDHIFVKKFSFGLRVPFSDHWLFHWSNPQRGEVIVFRFPGNEQVFYVKRLIGLPGDKIKVDEGRITVNGQAWELAKTTTPPGQDDGFYYFRETVPGQAPHIVRFLTADADPAAEREWTVPEHEYFFMGDNRDQSSDGRVWGFVPEKNLIGRAWVIWLSCDEMLESAKFVCDPATVRWNRIFKTEGL